MLRYRSSGSTTGNNISLVRQVVALRLEEDAGLGDFPAAGNVGRAKTKASGLPKQHAERLGLHRLRVDRQKVIAEAHSSSSPSRSASSFPLRTCPIAAVCYRLARKEGAVAQPFDRIDAVLARGIRYSDDYDTAKLQLAVFYYWAKASRAARASVRMAETGSIAEGLLLLRGVFLEDVPKDENSRTEDPGQRDRANQHRKGERLPLPAFRSCLVGMPGRA